MASEWFYTRDGNKVGPLSSAQLQAVAKSGKLKPTDKVWKEGMAKWVAASTIKGLFPSAGEAVTSKKPQMATSTVPSIHKGRSKTEKGKKPKVSDDEQEPSEERDGRGKVVFGIVAVAAVACVVCLGGVIVAGVLYLNSGTPEKVLVESNEKAKEGQVVEEKNEAPTVQPKDKRTEKKEPSTEQPKDKGTKNNGTPTDQLQSKHDPLLAQLTRQTSTQYKDYGFRKYGFGKSKEELKQVIAVQNLATASDDSTLTGFSSYGWMPTSSRKGVIDEFFYFDDDKLVGFGKLYLGDNKAYIQALLSEFGKTPVEHVHSLVQLHENLGQPENQWVMSRTYSYHFFPKTIGGICSVETASASTKLQWVEFCLFEREWFESTLDQHFASARKDLEKRKNVSGQQLNLRPINIGGGGVQIGEKAVPFNVVDPNLRAYLAQASSYMFVNGQMQFLMKEEGKGKAAKRTFVKIRSGTFIYLESENVDGRKTYQTWKGKEWSEPMQGKFPRVPEPPPVSLQTTRYSLDIDDKIRAIRSGVFSSFYNSSYGRLAQEYFPPKNPPTVFNSIKSGGQSVNPYLPNYHPVPNRYEWDTEDGLTVSIGVDGWLSVVRRGKKSL